MWDNGSHWGILLGAQDIPKRQDRLSSRIEYVVAIQLVSVLAHALLFALIKTLTPPHTLQPASVVGVTR